MGNYNSHVTVEAESVAMMWCAFYAKVLFSQIFLKETSETWFLYEARAQECIGSVNLVRLLCVFGLLSQIRLHAFAPNDRPGDTQPVRCAIAKKICIHCRFLKKTRHQLANLHSFT